MLIGAGGNFGNQVSLEELCVSQHVYDKHMIIVIF